MAGRVLSLYESSEKNPNRSGPRHSAAADRPLRHGSWVRDQELPSFILQVKDNRSGISSGSLEQIEGFGLRNMRIRASQINGKLDIQTAAGHGTSIVLTVPISTGKVTCFESDAGNA
jgi:nitrate/nitrite-specific signal transduction histidine kinase